MVDAASFGFVPAHLSSSDIDVHPEMHFGISDELHQTIWPPSQESSDAILEIEGTASPSGSPAEDSAEHRSAHP